MSEFSQILPSEALIAGPFSLYSGSFIIEFYKPDPQAQCLVSFPFASHLPNSNTEIKKVFF